MPYIIMSTNIKLGSQKILSLKEETGKILELIPGKNESQLMMQINDSRTMFYKGKDDPCMMIKVQAFGQVPKKDLDPFVKELTLAVEKITGIPAPNVYLTIDLYENWGVAGNYF